MDFRRGMKSTSFVSASFVLGSKSKGVLRLRRDATGQVRRLPLYIAPFRRNTPRCEAVRSAGTPENSEIPQPKREPVEDGVVFPSVSVEQLSEQASWLETELVSWLDSEWPEPGAIEAHRPISHQASQIYLRLRTEGVDDCSSLLLGIGAGLEGADFSRTYVGPWNIANYAAEVMLRRLLPERFAALDKEHIGKAEAYAKENNEALGKLDFSDVEDDTPDVDDERRRAASPNLADEFERYRFLQMVLDGAASKKLIDGAVAVAMGFLYDMQAGTWDGSEVQDDHFKNFGNQPPDVLGDESSETWTDTLVYLEKQLGLDQDDDGKIAAGLQMVLETLHGGELLRLQLNDDNDHAFKKRVAVAKWLHLRGGF